MEELRLERTREEKGKERYITKKLNNIRLAGETTR